MIARQTWVTGSVFAVTATLSRLGGASEVCTPGHSSPAALQAEENRLLGERHLEVARAQTLESLRESELVEAEKQFRTAVDGSLCIVPLYLLRLGETLSLQGRYLEARAVFQQLSALAPELEKRRIYAEPLRRANELNAGLDAKIASIRVVVHARGCSEPTVLIDGAPVESGPSLHDPGTLKIEASANGCISQTVHHKLREGASDRFEITLMPLASPPLPPVVDDRSWFVKPTLGVPRWVWVSAGSALAIAGGYASYRALSSKESDSGSLPSGSWGRAPVR